MKLLRVAITATLAAGAVGLWRQRREAMEARVAGVPPRRPAGDEESAGMGELARSLAAWVPTRPRGRLGRLAVGVWASPLTLVGVALGLLSGARPRWCQRYGCVVFEGAGGIHGRILESVGARANAIGQAVIVRGEDAPDHLLAHEAVHVRQAERFGALLFPLYLWLGARYGYRDHPLERAARLGARLS